MDKKKKYSNKKNTSNENLLIVIMNKAKYFITSAKISLILAIVFVFILITQRESNYFPTLLSSNTALLVIFIKIEWDEHKERVKNKYNNRKLILAYYNELRNIQLTFKQNKYQPLKDSVDFILIDEKMEEAAREEKSIDVFYRKRIKSEILRGLHDLEKLEVRVESHKKLETSIKNMLLESTTTISESLFEELWIVQSNYHELYIKPIAYNDVRNKINEIGTWVLKNPVNYSLSVHNWNELYKLLNTIDINVKLDKHMEEIINNMMKTIDENK
ncbi:hypothetical protein [Staphylococcus saprophyticus]|uniref:hypothetical protein n=1 Tax=Staphylococcus saprophyticus TaxID=29385 RepID=UPI0034C6C11C